MRYHFAQKCNGLYMQKVFSVAKNAAPFTVTLTILKLLIGFLLIKHLGYFPGIVSYF